jgi:hypothetical protein
MSRKPSRKVKRRNGQVNLTKGKVRITPKPSKQQLVAAARQLNRTKTRRYILYSVGCIILMQLVKYIVYNFIYVGDTTPGGITFLVVIYLQTGLMLVSIGLLVAAAVAYLRSLGDW